MSDLTLMVMTGEKAGMIPMINTLQTVAQTLTPELCTNMSRLFISCLLLSLSLPCLIATFGYGGKVRILW